ncbi:hypothetical protein MASR2M117_00640 [Paludibacter sp.]
MNKLKLHTHINEIEREAWKNLLDNSSYASFFQSPQCYEFYASLSFMQPFVFAVSEDDVLKGLVCGYIIADGGMIKRYFSRRAIIPGGLLLAEDISDDALTLLLHQLKKELKRKAIYIEIRNYKDYSIYKETLKINHFLYKQHLNFHVKTYDVDSCIKQLSSTKRRDIRVALRNGAEIVYLKGGKELREYHKILYELYTSRIKLPLFPYEFFEKLIQNDWAKIFGIKYEGEIIGGSTCVFLKDKIIYEWFVCGLDGKFKNIYPSTIATWAAIEYAAENDFQYFDMMGAGKPDDGYGVREFKSKFGGELVEHGRYFYITKPLFYKLGEFVITLLRKTN